MDSNNAPNGLSPDSSTEDAGSRRTPRTRRERLAAWLRRNSTHALVVGVAAAIAGAVMTAAVTEVGVFKDEPPKCPGEGCERKNPQKENCGVDALTFEPARENVARLQVRYSPRCGSAWGRIVNGEIGDKVTIRARGGGVSEAVIASHHDQFTKMVRVPSSFSVQVCAIPTLRTNRSASWDRYCVDATGKSAWKKL